MAAAKLVEATTTFATEVDDAPVLVREGEMLASTHPIVKAAPEMFAPVRATSR